MEEIRNYTDLLCCIFYANAFKLIPKIAFEARKVRKVSLGNGNVFVDKVSYSEAIKLVDV